jgi:hypothetical protein
MMPSFNSQRYTEPRPEQKPNTENNPIKPRVNQTKMGVVRVTKRLTAD